MTESHAIVLSGGSEAVSVALIERLLSLQIACSVISLVPDSLLRDLPELRSFRYLDVATVGVDDACDRLHDALQIARQGFPGSPVVFPTEDDGLLLLSHLHARGHQDYLFSRGNALRMGGLDKAELFAHLQRAGLSRLLAPTRRLDSPDDIATLAAEFGQDLVLKPIHKPWMRTLDETGGKVITLGAGLPTLADVKRAAERTWANCDGWIAQPRLRPIRQAERSVCMVRSFDASHGCQVVERIKYPRMGGSAAWVSTSTDQDLLPHARAIAKAIDLRGVCEMSFLEDDDGIPKLLELNCRPWLQFELVEAAGFPLTDWTLQALAGRSLPTDEAPPAKQCHWIQPERVLLSLLRGDTPRGRILRALMTETRGRIVVPVYGSRLPKVKRRWLLRNLRKLTRH